MNTNRFPQQPEDDLRVDTAWRENYSGASMNQKLHGIVPKGVYQGFEVKVKSGLTVEIHGNGKDNIAVIEVDTFSLTARMPAAKKKTVTLVAGRKNYVVLEARYAKNMASTIGVFVRTSVPDNAVLLAEITLAAGATSVSAAAIIQAPAAKPVSESDFAALFAMQLETATRVFKVEERLDKLEAFSGITDDGELDMVTFDMP